LGKSNSTISEVIATDTIFTDAGKGSKASEEILKEVFGTVDSLKVAEIILKKGDLQLTTDQRKQMVEEKRNQITAFISRECIDPKTNLPHPPQRIENAMGEIHFSIDPQKGVEEQARHNKTIATYYSAQDGEVISRDTRSSRARSKNIRHR
jgi:ribosome maturation protein SDO1